MKKLQVGDLVRVTLGPGTSAPKYIGEGCITDIYETSDLYEGMRQTRYCYVVNGGTYYCNEVEPV